MKKELNDRILLIPIIVLGIYFIIRLIDQSQMINTFPIDIFANDHSSHLARLHFLDKYGYNGIVPNWYNGFKLFSIYHPGWYLFVYPLYLILNNLLLTAYLSYIIMYLLGFLFIWYLGKLNSLSNIKKVALFLFFFVSPTGIGYFLRLGKYTELLGYVIFILLTLILLYYKDKEINWKFIFFGLIYGALMLAHIAVFIMISFLTLSLLLVKNWKEKGFILAAYIIGLIISSFFWVSFVVNSLSTQLASFAALKFLIAPGSGWLIDKIVSTLVPLFLLVSFYFYYKDKSKKEQKKEILFFSIPLILAFLLLTRLLVFIPFLNKPISDTYNFFFLFLAIYFLLKTKFDLKVRKFFYIAIVILPIIGIILSIFLTPWFIPHSDEVKETFKLMENVDGKLLIINSKVPAAAYYGYGAIFYDIYTPDGWAPEYLTEDLKKDLKSIPDLLNEVVCEELENTLVKIETKEVISYKENCNTLQECGFNKKGEEGKACLYEI